MVKTSIRASGLVAIGALIALTGSDARAGEAPKTFGAGAKKADMLEYLLGPAAAGEQEQGTSRSLGGALTGGADAGTADRGGLKVERPSSSQPSGTPTVQLPSVPQATGNTLLNTAAPPPDAPTTCAAAGKEYAVQVHFALGSYYLEPSTFQLLGEVAGTVTEPRLAGCSVIVEGHTDSTGDFDRNMVLSQKRAETVGKFLEVLGVKESRMQLRGKGSSQPADPANPRDGVNRRVQFRFIDREKI